MFDPKKEVPSLELCKKLKELDYPQDKYGFYWIRLKGSSVNENEWDLAYWDKEHIRWSEKGHYILLGGCDCCADYLDIIEKIKAPTIRELKEWLPLEFDYKAFGINKETSLRVYFYQEFWKDKVECGYYNQIVEQEKYISFIEDNEVNACAKLLIWLIENSYVKF